MEFSLGLNDKEVLELANRENRILIILIKDFGELMEVEDED